MIFPWKDSIRGIMLSSNITENSAFGEDLLIFEVHRKLSSELPIKNLKEVNDE